MSFNNPDYLDQNKNEEELVLPDKNNELLELLQNNSEDEKTRYLAFLKLLGQSQELATEAVRLVTLSYSTIGTSALSDLVLNISTSRIPYILRYICIQSMHEENHPDTFSSVSLLLDDILSEWYSWKEIDDERKNGEAEQKIEANQKLSELSLTSLSTPPVSLNFTIEKELINLY